MEKSIEDLIAEETTTRLAEMGSESYEFPKKANWLDAVGIIVCIAVSLALIILCMTGVIA